MLEIDCLIGLAEDKAARAIASIDAAPDVEPLLPANRLI
jgi:hypothetical protein